MTGNTRRLALPAMTAKGVEVVGDGAWAEPGDEMVNVGAMVDEGIEVVSDVV